MRFYLLTLWIAQSLLAQQYHTDNENFGNFIFSRACILARESGLHHASYDLTSSTLSAVEAEERQKVFRSLYIRERYSAIVCGTLTWLPSGGLNGSRPTSTSNANAQARLASRRPQPQHSPQWELAKMQDELCHMLSSVDVPEMSTSERQMSLTQLQQRLETWTQRHRIPSPSRPTTVDDISLHLAFLGTHMRMLLGDHNNSTGANFISEDILNDARMSCLLLVTSCNPHEHGALADRLDHLLMRTADPSRTRTRSSSNSPSQTPASSPRSATSGVPLQSSSPYSALPTHSHSQSSALILPPIHRLANVFPIVAIFVLARHVLGMGLSAQSSQPAPVQDAEWHHEINEDIVLLKALLSRFRTGLPSVKVSSRGRMDDVFHGSKLGRITNHLIEIINAIKGSTGDDNAKNANRDVAGNNLHAPEPLMASKSSLLEISSGASMPDLNYYSGSEISPSQLDLPLTPFSPQSGWAVTQELMPFSTTPLLTAANSSYAPSLVPTPPTMAETQFDISQFLHQTSSDSSPVLWDSGQGHTPVELQMQQQQAKKPQYVPETTAKTKSRKRLRTEGSRDY